MRVPNIRHMRRRIFTRLRNSDLAKKFIAYNAERTGGTEPEIFDEMKVPGSAQEVANIPNSIIED